jgi:hypothetical protein
MICSEALRYLSRLDLSSNGESKPPATLLVGPPGRMGAMVIGLKLGEVNMMG